MWKQTPCDLDLLSIDPSALIWIPVSEPPSENITASSSYQRPSNNQTESNDSVARGSLSGLSPLLTQPPSPLSRGRWWSTSQVPRLTWKSIQWVGEPDLVMLMTYMQKNSQLWANPIVYYRSDKLQQRLWWRQLWEVLLIQLKFVTLCFSVNHLSQFPLAQKAIKLWFSCAQVFNLIIMLSGIQVTSCMVWRMTWWVNAQLHWK